MARRRYVGDMAGRLQRGMDNVSQPLVLDTGTYWWIWGKAIKNGKVARILKGWYPDEQSCRDAGNLLMGNVLISFECVPLPTKDEAAASRIMRNKVAEETKSAEDTFRRFRHKVKESHPGVQPSESPSAWAEPEG